MSCNINTKALNVCDLAGKLQPINRCVPAIIPVDGRMKIEDGQDVFVGIQPANTAWAERILHIPTGAKDNVNLTPLVNTPHGTIPGFYISWRLTRDGLSPFTTLEFSYNGAPRAPTDNTFGETKTVSFTPLTTTGSFVVLLGADIPTIGRIAGLSYSGSITDGTTTVNSGDTPEVDVTSSTDCQIVFEALGNSHPLYASLMLLTAAHALRTQSSSCGCDAAQNADENVANADIRQTTRTKYGV